MAVVVDMVVVPRIDSDRAGRADKEHSHAIELMLFGGEGRTHLAVSNGSAHEVDKVRVRFWPAEGQAGYAAPETLFEPRPGFSVDEIYPTGRTISVGIVEPLPGDDRGQGPSVGDWLLASGGPTRLAFDVTWSDFQKKGRQLTGFADIAEVPGVAIVALTVPEPPTTRPTKWWRLGKLLQLRAASADAE